MDTPKTAPKRAKAASIGDNSGQPAPIGFSSRYDQLMLAMLEVQKSIYMPARNKTVTITPRQGPQYSFSYTTLDVILEMLKEPLVENQLVLNTLYAIGETAPIIVVRLTHAPSSQFIESEVKVPPSDQGVQGMGSATTYLRRYSIAAMFSLASDEDTDAAEALGNGAYMMPASPEEAERLAGRLAVERHSKLIAACNGATSPSGLLRMLQAWDSGLLGFMGYRDNPKHADQWAAVLDATATAMGRVHGMHLAGIWRSMLCCVDRDRLDQLRLDWEVPEVRAAREAMKKTNPEAYKRFTAGLVDVARRIETQPKPVVQQSAEVVPFTKATSAGAETPIAGMHHGPTGRGNVEEIIDAETPIDPEIIAEMQAAAAIDAEEAHCVFDGAGDPIDEPYRDRTQWVTMYAELYRESEDGPAVEKHNRKGLIWACGDEAAAALLQALLQVETGRHPAQAERPPLVDRDLFVPCRNGRGGGLDLISYLNDVQLALNSLSPHEVTPWIEANKVTYAHAEFPMKTRLKVLQLLAARAEKLGVKLG